MIQVRPSSERGRANHGWLDSRFSFSFADYFDPEHVHFGELRVINEDHISAGKGFGMHPHRDMEILTWVLSGELEHQDSMGHKEILRPGELQAMTAGTGINHSEYNASKNEEVHLLQIWIYPDERGLTPSYRQKAFPVEGRQGRWQTLATSDGRDESLTIHQDAALLTAELAAGGEISYPLAEGRKAWLQVSKGAVEVNGIALAQGDGAAVSGDRGLTFKATAESQVLLFDLA